MSKNYKILSSSDIDRKKWDACVDRNENGLIYARSVYLDHVSPNWKAIVFGDYEAVFPLTFKKKYGIRYLRNPPFTQQLGLIGKIEIEFRELQKIILSEVKYGDISFNFQNYFVESKSVKRTNYILDLKKSYTEIEKKFTLDLRKNIARANRRQLHIQPGNAAVTLIHYLNFLLQKGIAVSKKEQNSYKELFKDERFKQYFFCRDVLSADNELLASGIFLIDNKRIYQLMTVQFDRAKKGSPIHFLLNSIIHEFEHTDLILDFVGSDLPGVKKFLLNFSPINQPYYHWHFNHLPFPLNKLKR